MKSSTKIIIKARPAAPETPVASSSKPRIVIPAMGASSRDRESSKSTPETEIPDEDADEGVEGDNEDEEQGDGDDDAEVKDGEDEQMEVDTPVVRRPRGRPRGRGRGASTGTPRARGRGRGRGRGRPRGRPSALTIRLPKRQDEDGDASGVDSEVLQDDAIDSNVDADDAKVAPMGGGKPFRKIGDKVYIIEGDEFVTEDDPVGDTKIDKNGRLLGGRQFKGSTFVLPNRHPERLYMLAIDAARTSGFRDSLYYFRRNLLAFKLNATQPEKEYLIKEGKLGSHLKTRSVTLITARSAFKLHGSKMILDGKWVVDDYYESKALEDAAARGAKAGDPVGDLTDPQGNTESNNAAAKAAAKADRDRGGGGGMGIYRAGGPTTIFGGNGLGPYSDGPLNAVRKSMYNRDGVTEENWMWMMAGRVLEADDELRKVRESALRLVGADGVLAEDPGEVEDGAMDEDVPKTKRRKVVGVDAHPKGAYEPHTNNVLYRVDTQPTRSRWEAMPESTDKPRVLGGSKMGNAAWAIAYVDTVMEPRRPSEDGERQARESLMNSIQET
ncbi:hypothetical protein PC9H_000374 [Pleurotus ostreatus]|uniref:Uncharacterized protein n=1 Tax=Pleurotus ostreatus TaxID=5322 RepID=A0A8H7DXR6_PLEOS|nr:uncharacterized protein PC9H_000374 [Pleurotus ostreatus]KAF7440033.1 hypothetical protein PC9H_000374 [Pleurotus ostreatus]KAJ8700734.1 chromatin structure-remodeling complex subunit RSC7 [Pleurotus ostreatus]